MITQEGIMIDRTVGLQLAASTTREEVVRMEEALRRAIMEWGKIRLLVEVEEFRNMDPDALLEKLGFIVQLGKNIERVALVSRRVWIKAWILAGGLPIPMETKYFDHSDMEAAWQWLRA